MSPPANVIGKRTSSIRLSKSPLAARFKSLRRPDSAIMSAVTSSNDGPRKRKPGVSVDLRLPLRIISFPAGVILLLLGCAAFAQSPNDLLPGPKPPDVPEHWKPWIGDYGTESVNFTVGESKGHLLIIDNHGKKWILPSLPLEEAVTFESTNTTILIVRFERGPSGTQELLTNDLGWSKRTYGVDDQHVARMKPVHPIDELLPVAIAASPPEESASFRKPELVELALLIPSIPLKLRLATP